MQKIKKIVAAVGFVLFLLSCALAENGIRMEGEIGFDGVVRQGSAWRLTLNIESDTEIDGWVSVNVVKNTDVYDEVRLPIALEAGQSSVYHLDILPLAPQKMLDVRLISADGGILAFTTVFVEKAIPTDNMVIGVWGEQKLADALESHEQVDEYGRQENVSAIMLDAESFPENESEAAAFSLILINEHNWDELSEIQQKTLIAWMKNGGYLIVGTEKNWTRWTAALTMRTDKAADVSAIQNVLSAFEETEEGKATVSRIQLLTGGHALVCGFSLSRDAFLPKKEQVWRRVLTLMNGSGYTFGQNGESNHQFNSYFNQIKRVNQGKGILPMAWLLGLYVLVVGVGLYAVLRRKDASKWMWAAIPACAVVGGALIGLGGKMLGIGEPAAAQTLIISYDQDGDVVTEEQALVNYAGQERRTLSTQDGAEIEKSGWRSFYTYGMENTSFSGLTLQNVVTLGEQASIELESKATWLARELLIHSKKEPEGSILSSAWMDADGFHAKVENQTNVTLKNAVLLTSWGYSQTEQIASGETAEFFLPRQECTFYLRTENVSIPPDEALLFPQNFYAVASACSSPYTEETISQEENERQNRFYSKLNLFQAKDSIMCALIADCPEIDCSQILMDGEPIVHTARDTVVLCDIPIRKESPNGYLYADWTQFPVCQLKEDEQGELQMGEPCQTRYVSEADGYSLAYDLSTVDIDKIQIIRLNNIYLNMDRSFQPILEYYDHGKHEWVEVPESGERYGDMALNVGENRNILGENGELFLRAKVTEDMGLYLPSITAEGGKVQ